MRASHLVVDALLRFTGSLKFIKNKKTAEEGWKRGTSAISRRLGASEVRRLRERRRIRPLELVYSMHCPARRLF